MRAISFSKLLLHARSALSATSSTHILFSLQNYPHPPLLFALKYISTHADTNQHSYTVSYLINSCGLSPESAIPASKHIHFKTPDKPDKIINFLKNHGCSESQIAKIIKRHPRLLACPDPDETFLPQIEFFYSKGMSTTDLWEGLSYTLKVLSLSLKDRLIPYFDFMKSLLGSDDKVIVVIKHSSMLDHDYQSYILPNVGILKQQGVSNLNIMYALINRPRAFLLRPNRFKGLVEEVKLTGINPLRLSFVVAVGVKQAVSKSMWEIKHNAYKHWGFSDSDIFSAFVVNPRIMEHSKNKIMAVMDFLVNEMGSDPLCIIRSPQPVGMSLKKRIISRCSVIKGLWSKCLINKTISLKKVLNSTEKMFLQKFVICYEKEAFELLKQYQEALELSK